MNRDNDQIRALRDSYQLSTLSIDSVDTDPMKQFNNWFTQAMDAKLTEVNAMTLSTVNSDGQPSARIVLLKEIHDEGLVFYGNFESRKATDIANQSKVALLFFWKELQQQVRIEGIASRISDEQSRSYYHSRPRGSQIGAWSSPQSRPISREALEQEFATRKEQFGEAGEIPLPPFWGGHIVEPTYFEFWQGRESRLHDRIVYEQDGEKDWKISRIAP